ncbi:hypothetical protein G9A89_020356 [Geosiphon pyriformis]|nr:hypothetical protein G9A89_020356 [Geosiphon pyriformis]
MTNTRYGEWQAPRLKFNDNNENIMSEHVHNIDTEFDLRYLRKNAIKLKPHLHIYIDLKIALEISTTTMVQLISKSSLVKKEINIKGEIIDAEYIGNIIAILQNNSEKEYVIELNKKIAQTIFLLLVKIAQLVLVKTREKLGITAKEKNGFGSMGKIDILVNMVEKKVIDKEKIISTHQLISILLYDQYILAIEKKIKNQAQIFEVKATNCKSEKIGITNLYILAKSPKYIKISIYNITKKIIKIPKETIIGYLSTEVEKQLPSTISDFPQLCKYVDITL